MVSVIDYTKVFVTMLLCELNEYYSTTSKLIKLIPKFVKFAISQIVSIHTKTCYVHLKIIMQFWH